jgi:outer membrane lipoprotein SlyB
MEMSQIRNSPGLLYPMMIIAAIAVIVFSIVGIASITGLMPNAMIGNGTAVAAVGIDEDATPTFQCAECGVIQSVRDIEQRGFLWATPVAAYDEGAQPATTGL